MPHIHPLPVEAMTEESFEPFGELWHAEEKPSDRRILSPTSYSHDGRSTVHVIWQPEGGSEGPALIDIPGALLSRQFWVVL